jgi:hypothetical protein
VIADESRGYTAYKDIIIITKTGVTGSTSKIIEDLMLKYTTILGVDCVRTSIVVEARGWTGIMVR